MARHAEEPAVEGERRLVPADRVRQAEEYVAPGILGRIRGAEDVAAETEHAPAEFLVELGEALPLSAPGALDGPRHLGRVHGPPTSPTNRPPPELHGDPPPTVTRGLVAGGPGRNVAGRPSV